MMVDIVGSNCTGKSTLIKRGVEACHARHLDIAEHLVRYPSGTGPWSQQLRLLLKRPRSLSAYLAILRYGGRGLGRRFWTYFFIQATMLDGAKAFDGPLLMDEGVVKKLYEAVPFVDAASYERECDRWTRFASHTGRALVGSIKGIVDVIIYVHVQPQEFLARARARNFFVNEVGEERVLNRYLLQCRLYTNVLDEAKMAGMPVYEIDTTDMPAATERFIGHVSSN